MRTGWNFITSSFDEPGVRTLSMIFSGKSRAMTGGWASVTLFIFNEIMADISSG